MKDDVDYMENWCDAKPKTNWPDLDSMTPLQRRLVMNASRAGMSGVREGMRILEKMLKEERA